MTIVENDGKVNRRGERDNEWPEQLLLTASHLNKPDCFDVGTNLDHIGSLEKSSFLEFF